MRLILIVDRKSYNDRDYIASKCIVDVASSRVSIGDPTDGTKR